MTIPFLNIPPEKYEAHIKNLLDNIPQEDRPGAKNFFIDGKTQISTLSRVILHYHLVRNAKFSDEGAEIQINSIPQEKIIDAITRTMGSKKNFTLEQINYQVCNNIIRYWNSP